METAPRTCPECGGEIKHIPAGVSKKTGKPYGEFWACGNRCGFTWKKPKQPQGGTSAGLMELKKLNATLLRIEKALTPERPVPFPVDTTSPQTTRPYTQPTADDSGDYGDYPEAFI